MQPEVVESGSRTIGNAPDHLLRQTSISPAISQSPQPYNRSRDEDSFSPSSSPDLTGESSDSEPIPALSPKHPTQTVSRLKRSFSGCSISMDSVNIIIERKPENEGGTIFQQFAVLSNNVLGAGILAIASALNLMGVFWFLIGLLVIAFFSSVTMLIASHCCEMTKKYTWKEVLLKAVSPRFVVFMDILVLCLVFCILNAYIVIIRDYSIPVVEGIVGEDLTFTVEQIVLGIVVFLILIPLCLLKSLKSLAFTSVLATICVGVTVLLILVACIMDGFSAAKNIKLFDSPNVFAGFGIIILMFGAHINIPQLYYELKARTVPRMKKVVVSSMTMVGLLYLIISFSGYLQFGGAVKSNLLLNYPNSSWITIVSRLSMLFVVVFSFPVLAFAARTILLGLFNTKSYTLKIVIFITCVYTLTFFVTDLGVILGFTGSTVGSIVVFFLAPFAYLRLTKEQAVKNRTLIIFSWISILLCVVSMILGLKSIFF
ncbi:hypothetical protein PCE1_003212 [Barthelona sp. PCE]